MWHGSRENEHTGAHNHSSQCRTTLASADAEGTSQDIYLIFINHLWIPHTLPLWSPKQHSTLPAKHAPTVEKFVGPKHGFQYHQVTVQRRQMNNFLLKCGIPTLAKSLVIYSMCQVLHDYHRNHLKILSSSSCFPGAK